TGPPMNAVSQESFAASPVDLGADTATEAATSSSAGRVGTRALLAIISSFWLYVTLSNLLYAYAMQPFASTMTQPHPFRTWDARIIQHLLLDPVLFGCALLSMRIGWKPAWRTWPVQIILSLFFSALASPALMLGEELVGNDMWKEGPKPHTFAAFWKG